MYRKIRKVAILGSSDPVDIPEESYTLCEGNTYSISLDPAAGMYSWDDGSNGPEEKLIQQ